MLQTKVSGTSHNVRKNYNGIDIVKFFCAIMVFTIHIAPLTAPLGRALTPTENTVNFWLQNFLSRLAVPFYFVCSGFFLFKKMPSNKIDVQSVKKYCFKIIQLLGMWKVLLFLGETGHLWYLDATVVAVVLLSICLYYHIDLKYLVIMACAFYVTGLLGDSYAGLIEPFVSEGTPKQLYDIYTFFVKKSTNGFFIGYSFVLMGYFFAQGKVQLKTRTSLALFCASLIGLFAEVFLLHNYDIPKDHNMFVFLLPAVFFLFAFASSLSLKDRPVYSTLRTVGLLIYLLHLFIYKLTALGISLFYGAFTIDLLPIQFFISLFVTLLTAFGIERLLHKEKFKWLRWLIS